MRRAKAERDEAAVDYRVHLESEGEGLARKGERTRNRLLSTGIGCLGSLTPDELQVAGICEQAGLAKGTFYVHFPTKEVFLEELLADYVRFEASTWPDLSGLEGYEAVEAIVGWYERIFAANAGLMRCLMRLAERGAPFSELWQRRNRQVVDMIVASVRQRMRIGTAAEPPLRELVNALGNMMDHSMLARYRPGVKVDPEETRRLIGVHAFICHRALFGSNPATVDSSALRRLAKFTDPARWQPE